MSERNRLLNLYTHAPRTYKSSTDDQLMELELIKPWDGSDDLIEPNYDIKIFAKSGAISSEWFDCEAERNANKKK